MAGIKTPDHRTNKFQPDTALISLTVADMCIYCVCTMTEVIKIFKTSVHLQQL